MCCMSLTPENENGLFITNLPRSFREEEREGKKIMRYPYICVCVSKIDVKIDGHRQPEHPKQAGAHHTVLVLVLLLFLLSLSSPGRAKGANYPDKANRSAAHRQVSRNRTTANHHLGLARCDSECDLCPTVTSLQYFFVARKGNNNTESCRPKRMTR